MNKSTIALAASLALLSTFAHLAQAAPPPAPAECVKASSLLAGLVTDFDHWKAIARKSDLKEVQLMDARITSRKAFLAKQGDMQDVYQCQEMTRSILTDIGSVKFKLPDALALDKCQKTDGKNRYDNLSAKYEAAKTGAPIAADDTPAFNLIGMRLAKTKKDLTDENLRLPRCESILQELDEDGKALAAMEKKAVAAAKAAAKKK